jgi:hypothetical protein
VKLSVLFTLLFGAAMLFPADMNVTFAQDFAGDQIGEVSQDESEQPSSGSVGDKINDATSKLDTNEDAQLATDNILAGIKTFGDKVVAIPGFYWIAFAMMTAGLVSYLLQLVLGKLIMLARFHFSVTEILSDGLGLLISAIGLMLLTQAATAEGLVIDRPSFVLTAAGVGAFFGLIFYFRGQTQELREARALAASRKSE